MAAQREELEQRLPRPRRGVHGRAGRPAKTEGPELYPAFLSLAGRRCLVVGGGAIALQKTVELLRSGASVHAVAPSWHEAFEPLAAQGRLTRSTRAFERSDLDGAFLAVAATDDPAVQRSVWEGAEARGMLCNVVDVPELCSFQVPASLRRGSLTVSVSTAGQSPLFAVALRDRLAQRLPPELGEALRLLGEARRLARARFPGSQAERRRALGRLVTPEAIDQLMEGRLAEFEAHWELWKTGLNA